MPGDIKTGKFTAAHVIVAEIGIDTPRSPTVRRLISWSGLWPWEPSILTAAYHMLREGVPYREVERDRFNRVHKAKVTQCIARRLKGLGSRCNSMRQPHHVPAVSWEAWGTGNR